MNLWLVGLGILLLLQFAVIVGPPYVPTKKRDRQNALKLLELREGQIFYDLGCGDGSLVKEAAQKGIRAFGYEINPFWAAVAWLRTIRYRKNAQIILANFWNADISNADGVYVFLAKRYMKKLNKLMNKQISDKPIKLVSYGFTIPGKKATKKKEAMFLYLYN